MESKKYNKLVKKTPREETDADIENKLVVTSGKREVERSMIGVGDLEIQIIRHKMSYKHILYNTRNIANYFIKTILFVIFAFSHYFMSDFFPTPWIVACQACLSMEFSRQEYWSGVGCHFLLQGIFLIQEPSSSLLHWQADSLLLSQQRNPINNYKGRIYFKDSESLYCTLVTYIIFYINYTSIKKKRNSDDKAKELH